MTRKLWPRIGLVLQLLLLGVLGCKGERSGHVLDEASLVGRSAESFPAADEDYFHDMDGGIALTAGEVKGRNTWNVWTGGNDRFWDVMSVASFGNFDLLKIMSSHPKLKFSRDNRWAYLGLVNEPCFEKATAGDPQRYGLWLDKRTADCPRDPFENEEKYPGVAVGARGKNIPAGSFYGYATGIVGLRLFPNPEFDEAAARAWDAEKFYNDPQYYLRKDLVRPYRVGMSCGFCHVGPNPIKPPADPEHPKWENLSSNVGAQYFWVDRIFTWPADPSNYMFQLLHTSRPGTLDTSLVSTDNINNPRTMNAVYDLGPRLEIAKRWGKETIVGGERDNTQFNNYVKEGPLTEFFKQPDTVWTPRVLKDGSDSVGALGALNRVYLNIGLFSEEWLLHFNALVGGKRITPIEISVARKNSAYWRATEAQTFDMALFFVKSATPHLLRDAPGGSRYLTSDPEVLRRGKIIFAEHCARCHSSKQPPTAEGLDPGGCAGPDYLTCWNKYWQWTKTEDYKQKIREIVLNDTFLDGNYLSTDVRVPSTLMQTNACSPLATNALGGDIWDNFSSRSYKDLPSVGSIWIYDPFTGVPEQYEMPAGGRGYTRPASLISLWSTAPFLQNNTVGEQYPGYSADYSPSPSVEVRMSSFQDSIEKMLWPEKRERDSRLGEKVPGLIDRTTETSYLRVPAGYLPEPLQALLGPLERWIPWLFTDAGVEVGPIPKGVPVNLLANLNPLSESTEPSARLNYADKVVRLLLKLNGDLKQAKGKSDAEALNVFADLGADFMALSKCKDFVVNRGHYFGTGYREPGHAPNPDLDEPGLSDDDKRALIEFLKTL